MEDNCPFYKQCGIFDKYLNGASNSGIYKNLFCHRGMEGHENCKRYKVYETLGNCPDSILPNSSYSVQEIIENIDNGDYLIKS